MVEKEQQPVSNGLAVASLAVGIFAFLLSWTAVFGLPVSVVAIAFGVVALVNKQDNNMAIAGLVLGIVSFVVSAVLLAVALLGMNGDPSQAIPQVHGRPMHVVLYQDQSY